MIAELTGGQVARGVVDSYPKKIEPRVVTLRLLKAAELLGVSPKVVDERAATTLLLSIGLEVDGREGDAVRFRVPTFRPDLLREVDLIEELARLIGFDAIEPTLPVRTGIGRGLVDERRLSVEDVARAALEGEGFCEAINMAFCAPEQAAHFADDLVRVQNPLGDQTSVMRPSLLPGLLESVARNLRHGEPEVRLYEIGTAFLGLNPEGEAPRTGDADGPPGGDAFVKEAPRIAMVVAGDRVGTGVDESTRKVDVYDLLGAVEHLAQSLGFHVGFPEGPLTASIEPGTDTPWLHPRARGVWTIAGVPCGVVGELHPKLRAQLDIEGAFVAEIDTAALARVAREVPSAQRPPKFPSVRRDLALVVDEAVDAGELARALQSRGDDMLEALEIFDVYRGEHLEAGKKSIAISFVLRAADRTLTDEDVSAIADSMMNEAKARFDAQVRS